MIANINAGKIGQVFNGEVININQDAPWASSSAEEERDPAIKILFLAANPLDTPQLRLSEEVREIQAALRKSDFRDVYDFRPEWAVRIGDLQEHLLRHQPHVVHFSGHGSSSNGIILEDVEGYSRPVSDRALGFGRNVRTAFELGCSQIDLAGLNEQNTPKLLALNCQPEEVVFV
jgi:hypothetical protein